MSENNLDKDKNSVSSMGDFAKKRYSLLVCFYYAQQTSL